MPHLKNLYIELDLVTYSIMGNLSIMKSLTIQNSCKLIRFPWEDKRGKSNNNWKISSQGKLALTSLIFTVAVYAHKNHTSYIIDMFLVLRLGTNVLQFAGTTLKTLSSVLRVPFGTRIFTTAAIATVPFVSTAFCGRGSS